MSVIVKKVPSWASVVYGVYDLETFKISREILSLPRTFINIRSEFEFNILIYHLHLIFVCIKFIILLRSTEICGTLYRVSFLILVGSEELTSK